MRLCLLLKYIKQSAHYQSEQNVIVITLEVVKIDISHSKVIHRVY